MNNPKKLWWIFQQQFYGRGKYNRSDTLIKIKVPKVFKVHDFPIWNLPVNAGNMD